MFLPQKEDVADTNQLVLGNGVGDVHTVRIVGMTTHGCFDFGIQVSTIEIGRGDSIAIFRKPPAGKRGPRAEFETFGSDELIVRDVVVSRDLNIVDQCLGAFFD